jgi:iron complex transport system ATP-binding protein
VTPALRCSSVTVTFGRRRVLDGIDLTVAAGEWVNVIGPNGAGKTTLLRCVLDAVPHEGSVAVGGLEGDGGMARARALAYVPQIPVVPPGVAVIDYVLLGRTPHRGVFRADGPRDLAVASAVLDRLDLRGLAAREVGTLSGGERQRVLMARALVQESAVVLLDEPTTALDLGHQQEVLDLVDELRHERGLTVLATLHDLTLAARYGDRIAVLAEGRVVANGSPADVLTEDLIRAHFGAQVRIIDDVDGPVIVPMAARSAREHP